MEVLLYSIFIAVGLINTLHLGFYIVGANMYDIWQFRRRAGLPKRSRGLPLVSVIVPAHNEELVIERCLESIRKSSYRKIEVIVHNDCSTDATRRIIADYQRTYPKFNLRLVNRRHQAGKAEGVNYCIKRYATGDLVMTLDADCVLRKDAIRNATTYFSDSSVVGVAANVRLLDKPTVLGVLQKFEHLIGYRSKKFYTVTNCEFIVGGVASTYRHELLKQVKYYDTDTITEDIGLSMKIVTQGNRQHRIVYAADVVAQTEGAHNFRALLRQRYRWKMGCLQNLFKYAYLTGTTSAEHTKSLTWYRFPMAFLSELILMVQPFVIAYVVVASMHYHTLGFFLGAYLTITVYVLLTIWPDEFSTVREKLRMSLYAPVLYFTFYLMDAVQVIAIVRCMINPRQVARRTAQQSIWISPERLGQSA
jgi:cellulose synthase/poly-beta-1,6-N-acetylglucosamine synthase-like glycosyltransferase